MGYATLDKNVALIPIDNDAFPDAVFIDSEQAESLRTDPQRPLVAFVFSCFFVDFSLLTVVTTVFANVLSVPEWAISVLIGSKAFFNIAFSTTGARIVQRNPSTEHSFRVLRWTLAVELVTTLTYAVGILSPLDGWSLYALFFAARAVSGCASVVMGTAGLSLLLSTHAPEAHEAVTGAALSGQFLGAAGGNFIGGLLGYFFEWLPFVTVAAANLALLLADLFYFEKRVEAYKPLEEAQQSSRTRPAGNDGPEAPTKELSDWSEIDGEVKEAPKDAAEAVTNAGKEDEGLVSGVGVYRYKHIVAVVLQCPFGGSQALTTLTIVGVFYIKNTLGENQYMQAFGLLSAEVAVSGGCALVHRVTDRWSRAGTNGGMRVPNVLFSGGTLAAVVLVCVMRSPNIGTFCVLAFGFGLCMSLLIAPGPALLYQIAQAKRLAVPSCMAALDNGINAGVLTATVLTSVLLSFSSSYSVIALASAAILFLMTCVMMAVFRTSPL